MCSVLVCFAIILRLRLDFFFRFFSARLGRVCDRVGSLVECSQSVYCRRRLPKCGPATSRRKVATSWSDCDIRDASYPQRGHGWRMKRRSRASMNERGLPIEPFSRFAFVLWLRRVCAGRLALGRVGEYWSDLGWMRKDDKTLVCH